MSYSNDLAPCCANCNFSVTSSATKSTCHRHAPSPEINVDFYRWAVWPVIKPSDWCGEWAPAISYHELFADYLASNTSTVPPFSGIRVPPMPSPEQGQEPLASPFTTYDDPLQ